MLWRRHTGGRSRNLARVRAAGLDIVETHTRTAEACRPHGALIARLPEGDAGPRTGRIVRQGTIAQGHSRTVDVASRGRLK